MGRTGREGTFEGDALRVAQLLCATALFLFAFVPATQAAPSHPRLESLDITGLNHACGAAVDSKGDVYAASAGESKVKVFNEAHTLLKEIPNAHEPCALAVDTNGNLYVSEKATGEAVRYHPSEYPPTALVTYTETTIDSSGNAKGISVDPKDNRLYVAEGSHVSVYGSDGSLFQVNEEQRVRVGSGSTTGGTFTLSFGATAPTTTAPIPFEAAPATVQEALEELGEIGSGDVEVKPFGIAYLVTFKGALGAKDVEPIVGNPSGLTPSGDISISEINKGFSGHIGEGTLSGATGVAAVTLGLNRYVSVAEPGKGDIEVLAGFDVRGLTPRTTIDGTETPEGELGLAEGAYLGADSANGHLFTYDAAHDVLDEFEATGPYFTQISNPAFQDGAPTQVAVDRSGGANSGTLYVGVGGSAGAKALAFGPVVAPGRADLPPLSHAFNGACGTTVDSHGDLYVAGESIIRVYSPKGSELTSIPDSKHPCSLAVDSKGNLYAAEAGTSSGGDESVSRFVPAAFPPGESTTYTKASVETVGESRGIAVNPADDHLFVVHATGEYEYDSAANGSALIDADFCGLKNNSSNISAIGVYGANGDVYILENGSHPAIEVCDASGKLSNTIDGQGSPAGGLSEPKGLAVDQANGHVLVGQPESRGTVEEFEASGAFVGEFGAFAKTFNPLGIAVDNSGGPTEGNLYVAFLKNLTAFGPLAYGEPPLVVTGTASEIAAGQATLNGTVNPRGAELEECAFEWGKAGHPYEHREPCAETPAQIGKGKAAVSVHHTISGLEPETTRYRFRLVGKSKFGEGEGEEGIFGPPLVVAKGAQPILYHEATLNGEVDPSGLVTSYRFQYLTQAEYEEAGESFESAQSTPAKTLPAGGGPTDISAYLSGLAEGTTYRFRLAAENEAATAAGPAQRLTTLSPRPNPPCPNATLRLENNSTGLPDCRAYELVTPADTRGAPPHVPGGLFNIWPVTPSGPLAGESLAFAIPGSLPGTEGNGTSQHFRATRGAEGWTSDPYSPTYADVGGFALFPRGLSPDQRFSFWAVFESGGSLSAGTYLRTPAGSPAPSSHCAVPAEPEGRFELIGCGSLGDDPGAEGDYISPGGTHVIFASETTSAHTAVRLEPEAPASPLSAVYDRSPGGPTHVISLLPGDLTPSASANYLGATPDGATVVFSVGTAIYARIDDAETVKVTDGPASFAGISADGNRVFYTDKSNPKEAAGLWVCEIEEGACAATEIATNAKFVHVAADGERAYYATEGAGQPKLYAWDGSAAKPIATLDSRDVGGHCLGGCFPGTGGTSDRVALDAWSATCVVSGGLLENGAGRATCPSRTSPDGRFLVFQSHADLTPPYEGQGHSEIYRYDASDGSLLCVSCDPSGIPATAEADLQSYDTGAGTQAMTLIPGISKDGSEVFFQTETALLPEDANSVTDVYEWKSDGIGGCEREEGCLSLISSGQGDEPSYIYSMTPDGHDVFFSTTQKLIGSDLAGSPSIYDARVDGGFPPEVEKEACHGDACQGEGSAPPSRPSVHSDAPGSGNVEEPATPKPGSCPKGRRTVKRGGKTHCVKPHHHKRHKRAKAKRRAGR